MAIRQIEKLSWDWIKMDCSGGKCYGLLAVSSQSSSGLCWCAHEQCPLRFIDRFTDSSLRSSSSTLSSLFYCLASSLPKPSGPRYRTGESSSVI